VDTEYAIQTTNLTKTFKSKTPNGNLLNRKTVSVNAVDNLNFAINKGELYGLLGPNGAGKTTLVKMLCTLLPPDRGIAKVNGYDIVKQQLQVKQSLGTLFSVGERGFFWRLNGYRNLEFFAAIYNVPKQQRHSRILKVLELVGLENSTYQLYQKYSGGMKRKLALARTLLPDPPIMLLDEPTTGLDATASRNIRDFIKCTVAETGKTVLYTTHYIEEAAQICTKIGILSHGHLIAQDTPEALRSKIKKGEQIFLVVEGMTPQQTEKMREIKGVVSLVEKNGELLPNQTGLVVKLENVNQLPSLFDFLFENKITLLNFKREEPTLEDAFIELTSGRA
jgi:ABC-2 type transport system ATP-binding protein